MLFLIIAAIWLPLWAQPPAVLASTANSQPTKLFIPKLGRVLPVDAGYWLGEAWTVSQNGVSWWLNSTLPGHAGNSVFYGHNRPHILRDLPRLVPGDSLFVVMESGDFAKYQVFAIREVKPQDVTILNQQPEARLTLYTCSGANDSLRFVVFARLVDQTDPLSSTY